VRQLPLLVLLACNGADDTDRNPPGPRGTDGDADTDTDADSDTDTDTDSDPDPSKCPVYTGLRDAGRTWSWRSTAAFVAENDFSNTWTNSLVTLEPKGDHADVSVFTDGVSDIDNVDEATFETTVTMRCDIDGLWLLSTDFSYRYVVFGIEDDGFVNTTYSSPELVWQRGATVGSSWSTPSEGTTTSSEDGTSSFANTMDYVVAAEVQTTVPAGTFTTLRVEVTSSADGKTSTSFVDRDLGSVLTDVGELTGSNP
jgi:hypothetical protein